MRNDVVARCGADLPAHAWVPAPRIVFGASGHRGCLLEQLFKAAHILAITNGVDVMADGGLGTRRFR